MKTKLQMMTGTALAVLALAPAWAVHAQTVATATAPSDAAPTGNAIAEVVVTATKTGATNLQKTALSVSVVGGGDLVKDDIQNIKDLAQVVPSLIVTTNNINPQIYIRGVGGFQGGEGDVSFYEDGVYLSRPSVVLQSDFNDLDRVEVAEGPQGTVFGRNSNGGAINFISKAPTNTFTFADTFQTGNYNLIDEAATISGPLLNNVQARLSVSHVQHDGYLQNVDPGVGNPDAANRTAVRGQIRWEPTDAIVNTLHADYLYTHEQWATNDTFLSPTIGITWAGGDPLLQSINGQLDKVDVVTVPYQTELSYGVTDDFSWKLNDFLTLKSITAVRTDHSVNYQDGLSDVYFQGGYSAYDEQQDSQEFNLVNNVGPLSGVAGLYYFNDAVRQIGVSLNYGGNLKVPNPAGGTETYQLTYIPIISRAAFFEETYHFTPELSVTVGARYTEDHKTLNTFNETVKIPAGFPQNNTYFVQGVYTTLAPPSLNPYIADLNQNENATTPKIAINWQATPGALLYLSATNGFKSGGFSNTARATLGAAFGPEHIWAYELGAKTDWFDHSLRINVALFHYIWAGQQFNALIEPQLSVTTNAGGSTLNGLEANIISKPIKGLTLTANAVLLSTKYTDFPSYTFPGAFKSLLVGDPNYNVAAGTYNATGKQLVDAPNVSLNFTGQKDFDLPGGADFFVRAEYDYVSKMYLDPTNVAIATRPDVNLINASIGYSPAGAHWTVSFWAKNLENNIYINGIAAGSTITAPITEPRTFGIRINYNY